MVLGLLLVLILIFLICVICANQWRKKILLLILKLLNYPITQFSICLLSLGLDFSHRIERYVDLIDVDVSRRNGHLVENSTAQVTRAVVIIGGKRVSSRVPRDHLHKILSRHGPAHFHATQPVVGEAAERIRRWGSRSINGLSFRRGLRRVIVVDQVAFVIAAVWDLLNQLVTPRVKAETSGLRVLNEHLSCAAHRDVQVRRVLTGCSRSAVLLRNRGEYRCGGRASLGRCCFSGRWSGG